MQANADLTLYVRSTNASTRAEEWTRVQLRCITWQASAGAKVLPNGTIKDDKATVYIPFERGPLNLQEGSVIVKGLVNDEITDSFTMTDLRKKYPDNVLTIRRVTPRDYGSAAMRHWEIAAS
jgi:hypothetical protein